MTLTLCEITIFRFLKKDRSVKVAIVGFGLIGSSIARSALRADQNIYIQAIDEDPKVLDYAKKQNLCRSMGQKIADIEVDTDIVVLATPVGVILNILPQIIKNISPDTIITDVGSVKGVIAKCVKTADPEFDRFVPAHPMAGSHLVGPQNGQVEMFDGRRVFLTPNENTSPKACEKIRAFFESLGASVTITDVETHDRAMAYVSHLPHFLAFAYMKAGHEFRTEQGLDYFDFCAGGFRDFTRIAQSDTEMWTDIFKYNKEKLLQCLEDVTGFINTMADETANSDFSNISKVIDVARTERQKVKVK